MSTRFTAAMAFTAIGIAMAAAATAQPSDNFIIHQIDQTPQEAAKLIRDHIATSDDWSLNAEFEIMGGKAVGMKVCFNAMRGHVVAAGLHNLAMMPCGNLAFYTEADELTYLSMLDVSYLTTLSPHPELEKGVALARPAYAALFSDVLGVE
ncbi:hypothetical protein ILP92_17605 [Maribius pontilimi]|uniref:DUF302 domain-containing protein n=1 Tax=Palleronia pontilimi TaxID=1964209 RepID=A0A934MIT4_9RHOB|nr:hypothetical protein [Palleronia pontilimi]MBJ3764554.1 hypothetical protein [Palleronia pontilimi]